MIPRTTLQIDSDLPVDAVFGLPSPDDISEEGFAFFRGTWFLGRLDLEFAQAVLDAEADALSCIDALARTEDEFDGLATVAEAGDDDSLPERWAGVVPDAMKPWLRDDDDLDPFDGLEVGVAGLTCALSAAGFLTAASCRGHPNGWADHPVVYFATTNKMALVLEPVAVATGCGFTIDTSRPELLVIEARSARDTHAAAVLVMESIDLFRSCWPDLHDSA